MDPATRSGVEVGLRLAADQGDGGHGQDDPASAGSDRASPVETPTTTGSAAPNRAATGAATLMVPRASAR